MFDWSSPRQRRKNGAWYACTGIALWWLLLHWPPWGLLYPHVTIAAYIILACGLFSLVPMMYDVPYIKQGEQALATARLFVGFNAEQPEGFTPKATKLGKVAYLEITFLPSSEEADIWQVRFDEPGRSLLDYFWFYEDGRVYWQEASSEKPLRESAWHHAGWIRLKWLNVMLQQYGDVPTLTPRRAF